MKKLILLLILSSIELFASVGKVYAIRGEGYFQRGTEEVAITLGAAVEEKDIIKTSKATKVQVIFEDRTIVTVGQNTEFAINEYKFDGTPDSNLKFGINKGIFKSITGKLGKLSPQNFKIATKTSTIGIRGTTFVVSVTDQVTLLGTLSGRTYFTDNATAQTFDVGVNQQLVYNDETKEIKVVPLKIKDVTISDPSLAKKKKSENKNAETAQATASTDGKSTEESSDSETTLVLTDNESETDTPEGGIPLDSITGDDGATALEGVADVASLVSTVTDVAVDATPLKTTIPLTYGGSYGYEYDVNGFILNPFVDGTALNIDMYRASGLTAQYSGSLAAIVGGKLSTGTFTLKADFYSSRIDGSMDFTDTNNRHWALIFSQENGIAYDSFYVSSDSTVSNGVSTGDIDITGGSIDGRFFGNSATSTPTVGEDSVGGTFTLEGNVIATNEAVSAAGSFGGWMTPDILTYGNVKYLTYGGSYGYYTDASGAAFNPFVLGTPLNISSYYTSGLTGQYAGALDAIVGGGVTTGYFTLNANFYTYHIDGSMDFTDTQNRAWAVSFAQDYAMGLDHFYLTGGSITSSTRSDIAITDGTIQGQFFGNSATSAPTVGEDSVGATFTLAGTDTIGTAVSAEGAFGGLMTTTTPVLVQTTVFQDTYYSFGYWDAMGVASTPWASGTPLDAATIASYITNYAYGSYSGGVAAITSSGGVTTGTFSLYADFAYNSISGSIMVTDADNLHWGVSIYDNTSSPITGSSFTVSGGSFTNTQNPIDVSVTGGTMSGSFYGASGGTVPTVGVDSTAGTFTIQGDNGGASTTITGAFGGVAAGGV